MNGLRRFLFLAVRLIGDFNALSRGRVAQRTANRVMGRAASRAMSRLWR